MKNPFIGTALLIWMQHVKHQKTSCWLEAKHYWKETQTYTHKLRTKIIKNVLSFSLLILSITFLPKKYSHTQTKLSKESWRKR